MLKIFARCAIQTVIAALLVFCLNLFINVPMDISYYIKYGVLLFVFTTILELVRKRFFEKKK